MLRGDPNAVVLDPEARRTFIHLSPKMDSRGNPGANLFQGIGQKIRQDLVQHRRISDDLRQWLFDFYFGLSRLNLIAESSAYPANHSFFSRNACSAPFCLVLSVFTTTAPIIRPLSITGAEATRM